MLAFGLGRYHSQYPRTRCHCIFDSPCNRLMVYYDFTSRISYPLLNASSVCLHISSSTRATLKVVPSHALPTPSAFPILATNEETHQVRNEPAVRRLALPLDLDDDAVRSRLGAAVQPARDDGELVQVGRAVRAGALGELDLGVAVAVPVRVAVGACRPQSAWRNRAMGMGGGPSCFFWATSSRALAAVFSISEGL